MTRTGGGSGSGASGTTATARAAAGATGEVGVVRTGRGVGACGEIVAVTAVRGAKNEAGSGAALGGGMRMPPTSGSNVGNGRIGTTGAGLTAAG